MYFQNITINLTNRFSQGIDIEFDLGDRKIAIEVKTSENNDIKIELKDIEGLERLLDKGFHPYIAFLGGGTASDWLFVPYSKDGKWDILPGKKLQLLQCEIYSNQELRNLLGDHFDQMVEKYAVFDDPGNEILLATDRSIYGLLRAASYPANFC